MTRSPVHRAAARVITSFREWRRAAFDLVLPPFCALCGPWREADADVPELCASCESDLLEFATTNPDRQCRVCAAVVPVLIMRRGRCPMCVRKRPAFRRLTTVADYDGPWRDLVNELKYRGNVAAARPLGEMLARHVEQLRGVASAFVCSDFDSDAGSDRETRLDARIDLLVPIPLDPRRRRSRGFNQTELIVCDLGERVDLEVDANVLGRRRGRAPQVGRSRAARRKMSSEVFCLKRPVFGRRVLLVDDVVTTGATFRAAARGLKDGGALDVRAVAVTRTRGPGEFASLHGRSETRIHDESENPAAG